MDVQMLCKYSCQGHQRPQQEQRFLYVLTDHFLWIPTLPPVKAEGREKTFCGARSS